MHVFLWNKQIENDEVYKIFRDFLVPYKFVNIYNQGYGNYKG